jgi:hypothetical protein
MVTAAASRVTPVTATTPGPKAVTVTAHSAVKPPSAVVTVIVAVPADTPVTRPVALTEATAAALDDQVTLGSSASEGSP